MTAPRWTLRDYDHAEASRLASELDVPQSLAAILLNRGITTAEAAQVFWNPDPDALHPPEAFAEMAPAVDRLEHAIKHGENIRVFGDYDADGVSGTTLLVKQLRRREANVDYAVANRFTDGYGIKPPTVAAAKADGVNVLITVDNGSTAYDAHDAAAEAGIDLIVCDHHTLGPHRPNVCAHLNPKAPECAYPFPDLCGAGVAWKLAQGMGAAREELTQYAVIGTIADIVPLHGENRTIATMGLPRLTKAIAKGDPGLRGLAEVCGVIDREITGYHVGFALGPRINAAGRMEDASLGVQLLLSQAPQNAQRLARQLDGANKERQRIQQTIEREAVALVESDFDLKADRGLVLADPEWHEGIIGIVASRIVDMYHRPTVLLGESETPGIYKGSGRSINGFDLHGALSECQDMLLTYGGHVAAAGLTIEEDRIVEFQEAFNSLCSAQLAAEDLTTHLTLDAELPLGDVTRDYVETLHKCAPFGAGNATPTFLVRNATLHGEVRVLKSKHLKFSVAHGDRGIECIAFSMSELKDILTSGPFDLAVRPEINEWMGRKTTQLQVRGMRPAEPT